MLYTSEGQLDHTDLQQLLTTFYHTTRINIAYLDQHGSPIDSRPSQLPTNPYPIDPYPEKILQTALQYPQDFFCKINNYEYYLYLQVNSTNDLRGFFIVGPVLCTRIDQSQIEQYVQNKKLPFKAKYTLQEYFDQIPLIDYAQIPYFHILLRKLIHAPYIPTTSPNDSSSLSHTTPNFYQEPYKNWYQNWHPEVAHSTPEIEEALFVAFQTLSKQEYLAYLASMSEKVWKMNAVPHLAKDDPIRSAKNMLIVFIALLARNAIRLGVPSHISLSLSDMLIQEVETLQTQHEIQKFTFTCAERYLDLKQQVHSGRYSYLVNKARRYIDEHIADPLSLKSIASALDVNPGYLSHLFKREKSQSITDYIHERKIDEAKRLLKYTNLSIVDVALRLHFTSQSYLTVIFKKYTGMTPTRYRSEQL
ncbi:MAG TPA: AraC family transcriptional regulator [Ktedonobacteraceae bacterium]|nr:AraC family transcriptional regulator [Ktedonobacteraceae bacterium]